MGNFKNINKINHSLRITFILMLALFSSAFASTTYQAEKATLVGARVVGSYVDYINSTGDYVEWSVSAAKAGVHDLDFRYALLSGGRSLEIRINGIVVTSKLYFPATGSWSVYKTVRISKALTTGVNKIRAVAIGTSGPNMDALIVAPSGAVVIEPDPPVTPPSNGGSDWSMVCIPDTQTLVYQAPTLFNGSMTWLRNNVQSKNIRHIFHMGDMVEVPSNPTEWVRAKTAMNILNPILPSVALSITIGGHDFDQIYNTSGPVSIFSANFGNEFRRAYPWYKGTISTDRREDRNHYCKFTVNGVTYLSMDVQHYPRTSDIQWAKAILSQNKGVPTIFGSHAILRTNPTGERYEQWAGQLIWNEIINHNNQIFLTVSGHYASHGGSGYHVRTNAAGQKVVNMVVDFQSGVNNALRLITFQMASNNLHFQTYSPSQDKWLSNYNLNGNLVPMDFNVPMNFAARFASMK